MTATSASSVNVATFVEVLKRSDLIAADKLDRVLKSVALTSGQDRTSDVIAEQLVVAGLITKWQAAQLLRGKHRGFALGKYVIRKPLGRGGMGIVYEAEHKVLNTRVAIKILPKARNDVEKSVSRFLAEARAAAKLEHPNIVHVHDCDVIDGRRFMVMDLVEGSNLGEIIERSGPMQFRNAILLLKQAAAGLGYAHEQGITHRDVKPQNFLIDHKGQLKVADMGLALFDIDSPERHTADGNTSMLGTVDYVAPEQAWDSRRVDRRADMYSLGCTLYFMIAGRPPFDKGTLAQRLAMHQTAQPTPLTEIRSDCPMPIWRLCEKMMAKKPQERLQKMSDVVRVCDQLLPRLSGGQDLSTLASGESIAVERPNSMGDSWSTEPFEMASMSFDPGGFDAAMSTMPSLGMSMETFDSAVATGSPMGQTGGGGYWNQTAAAPKAKAKKPISFQESIYARVAVFSGLALAVIGLGISIWMAVNSGNTEHKAYVPKIKQIEGKDGSEVIIVDMNNPFKED